MFDKLQQLRDELAKVLVGQSDMMDGLLCGLLLFAATSLQQIGLVYTSAGKAGFITAPKI